MSQADQYRMFSVVYDEEMRKEMGNFYKDYFNFILKVMDKNKSEPKDILELACGTGNLSKLFLERGYKIEGLDLSNEMSKIARKKGVRCRKGNIVNFNLKKKFDLILCIFDSLNYIQKESDLGRCFRSVSNHLEDGGVFIFDMNSDYKINRLVRQFTTQHYKNKKAEWIWLNSHQPNKWIAELVMFFKRGKLYERFYEKHVEKAYRMGTIKNLLEKAELKIIGIYSDFKFTKVNKKTRRWFFVVQKESGG